VLDPAGVFQYFCTVANVGAQADEAGLSVRTDIEVEDAWAQVLPAGSDDWSQAVTIAAATSQVFEVDTVATEDAETYQDSITGQPLRSHEFDVAGLEGGERYQYR